MLNFYMPAFCPFLLFFGMDTRCARFGGCGEWYYIFEYDFWIRWRSLFIHAVYMIIIPSQDVGIFSFLGYLVWGLVPRFFLPPRIYTQPSLHLRSIYYENTTGRARLCRPSGPEPCTWKGLVYLLVFSLFRACYDIYCSFFWTLFVKSGTRLTIDTMCIRSIDFVYKKVCFAALV